MSEMVKTLPAHYRDMQGKTIFKDAELCAQFLRENIDHPIIRRVRAEDIEDYTERFIPFFGNEFESDTIKRICIKCEKNDFVFYMISLIEHKSTVDYNVTMQLLKYMVCVWMEYEKSLGEGFKNKVKNKSFRYPPILPIVYYEGKENWTAGMELKDRKEMEGVLDGVDERILDILGSVMLTLCRRVNATEKETEKCLELVRRGSMGYLFENMEKMDIQAERRNTAQARAERDAAYGELDAAYEELEKWKKLALAAGVSTEAQLS